MVRSFISKNLRGKWSVDVMRKAVSAVLDGGQLRTVSEQFHVPRNTLRKKVAASKAGKKVVKRLGKATVLGEKQEQDLVSVVLLMESRLFGLSLQDLRRLVYQFCVSNDIVHPFNKHEKMAGVDWARQFLKRHPKLSIRTPEGMSIGRAIGFNREKTIPFYNILKEVLFREEVLIVPIENIFNVDETGLTICQKPQKVIAERGKRCVATITSAEKGKTVTVICCVSGAGVFLPPVMIFPRVRMKAELIDKAPNGTMGLATKSGWVNEEAFIKWFEFFIQHTQPRTREHPVVLIMDGHSSHTKSLTIIDLARDNNVIFISLPSHCTHRMQPLDVSFFKSLKAYYNKEVQCWLRRHPGRPVTEYQIAELFGSAYGQAASVGNALAGFRATGIVPFNPDIFTESDFVASSVTDQMYDEIPVASTSQQGQAPLNTEQNNFVASAGLPTVKQKCHITNEKPTSTECSRVGIYFLNRPPYLEVITNNVDEVTVQPNAVSEVAAFEDTEPDVSAAKKVVNAGEIAVQVDVDEVTVQPNAVSELAAFEDTELDVSAARKVVNAGELAAQVDVIALVNELVQGGYITPDVAPVDVDSGPSAVDENADVSDILNPAFESSLSSLTNSELHVSFQSILENKQTPYHRVRTAVKRKVAHAAVLTSSPYKKSYRQQKLIN